jgi:hypothetical protein
VTDRAAKLERVVMPALAVVLFFAAWLAKLWYDTSSSRDENVWGLLFWPVAAAMVLVTCRAVLVWLPAGARTAVFEYPWQSEVVRVCCAVTCAASIVVLGRVALFVRSENWYFEAAWAYSSGPAIVLVSLPVLTFLAAAALWPTTRSPARARDLLSVCFNGLAMFLLLHVWWFLSRAACETCSGPAL